MTRSLLFLDIDGVLNSHVFLMAQHERLQRATGDSPIRSVDDRDADMIDPAAVAVLDELCKRADCDVVLSSSWRIIRKLATMRGLLGPKGFTGRLVGKTPYCGPHRGNEIQKYLDGLRDQPRGIVILDDSSDMEHLLPWLVRTDFGHGLQREHIDEALQVIARPAPMRLGKALTP